MHVDIILWILMLWNDLFDTTGSSLGGHSLGTGHIDLWLALTSIGFHIVFRLLSCDFHLDFV